MGRMPAKCFLGFPVYRLDQTMYEDNAKNWAEIRSFLINGSIIQYAVFLSLTVSRVQRQRTSQVSTGSNMTDPAGSDYATIEVVTEPLASAPPDASVLSFEHLIEHGLHTEVEPQVSEAAVEIDSSSPPNPFSIFYHTVSISNFSSQSTKIITICFSFYESILMCGNWIVLLDL